MPYLQTICAACSNDDFDFIIQSALLPLLPGSAAQLSVTLLLCGALLPSSPPPPRLCAVVFPFLDSPLNCFVGILRASFFFSLVPLFTRLEYALSVALKSLCKCVCVSAGVCAGVRQFVPHVLHVVLKFSV